MQVALLVIFGVHTAKAHEAAAEAPIFAEAPCVTVVDKSVRPSVSIAYNIAYDDVMLEAGDIPVEDAKTHQFFAFRGAIFKSGLGLAYFPHDAPSDAGVQLPLWITLADVKRAANASGDADGTGFSEQDVPEGAVLEDTPQLAERWLRIHPDGGRLPITLEQATRPVVWNVSDVPPGLYTVVTYIFSPPWNGWALRPGLVKVVDGTGDGEDAGAAGGADPAAVVDEVDSFVFSYQGRRVGGCLDAAPGTVVRGMMRVDERAEHGWQPWLDATEVSGERFDFCFVNPYPELTGSVRLRFDLEAPDGTTTYSYSPDLLTYLSGSGSCEADEEICCEGVLEALATGDGGVGAVGKAVADAPGADGVGGGPEPASSAECGCRLAGGRPIGSTYGAFGLLALCAQVARRRRKCSRRAKE